MKMKVLDSLKQRSQALKRDILALWFAYQDRRTPWLARVLSMLVVAYALSPIDLIPDFVPILGYLDDLILIPAGIALVLKMIPDEVMNEARIKAEKQSKSSTPGSKIVAVFIILVWLALLFFIGRAIFRAVNQ